MSRSSSSSMLNSSCGVRAGAQLHGDAWVQVFAWAGSPLLACRARRRRPLMLSSSPAPLTPAAPISTCERTFLLAEGGRGQGGGDGPAAAAAAAAGHTGEGGKEDKHKRPGSRSSCGSSSRSLLQEATMRTAVVLLCLVLALLAVATAARTQQKVATPSPSLMCRASPFLLAESPIPC